jgi:hypothetical protein
MVGVRGRAAVLLRREWGDEMAVDQIAAGEPAGVRWDVPH